MAHKAPVCGAVCPLAYTVVPAAAYQGGMTQQPMPMGMMFTSMAAPVMMPLLDGYSGSAYYGAPFPGFADVSYQWAAEAPFWPAYGENAYYGEEAPQQLPMKCDAAQVSFSSTDPALGYASFGLTSQADAGHSEAETPAQIQMDPALVQPGRSTSPTERTGTLRRRRGQGCSMHEVPAGFSDLPTAHEQQSQLDGGADALNAQAREVATNLLVQMRAGGNAQWEAVSSFERLAFTSKVSSLAAQMVLEEAAVHDKVALASSLHGHVCSAVQSKHANHVLQKVIGVMPVTQASFIVEELKGSGYDVARHIFGCRVLCRILEHLSATDSSTIELVEEVFTDIEELCNHAYGSFVVRHLLEFGLPEHKHRVVSALRTNIVGYTKHKFGSHVVESALRHASARDQQVLASELLQDKELLMTLAASQFGRHVVRALLALPDGLKKQALDVLLPMEAQLKSSRYGKSVFQAVRAAALA